MLEGRRRNYTIEEEPVEEFKNLKDYLMARMRVAGHSTLSLSEALGFSSSYISGIMNGQFKPSIDRLQKIAQYFNDDEQLILTLAGYYTAVEDSAEKLARQIATLSPEGQQFVARVIEYQRWVEQSSK